MLLCCWRCVTCSEDEWSCVENVFLKWLRCRIVCVSVVILKMVFTILTSQKILNVSGERMIWCVGLGKFQTNCSVNSLLIEITSGHIILRVFAHDYIWQGMNVPEEDLGVMIYCCVYLVSYLWQCKLSGIFNTKVIQMELTWWRCYSNRNGLYHLGSGSFLWRVKLNVWRQFE